MQTVFGALLLLISVNPEETRIVYNAEVLPQFYQTGSESLNTQLYNPSTLNDRGVKSHPFGTPNSHFPWLHPGGVPEGRQVVTVKELILPPATTIDVRLTVGELPKNYSSPNKVYSWTFPVGTVAKVHLFGEHGEFGQHISTKVREGNGISAWDGEEVITGRVPSWYKAVNNCNTCHEDIGKHARVLRPKEENYYHWLRGGDGRFSWHPYEFSRNPKESSAIKLRNDPYIRLVK